MRDLKHLTKPKPNRLVQHWKTIAFSCALVLLLIPLTLVIIRKGAQAFSAWQTSRQQAVRSAGRPTPLGDQLFTVADGLLPRATHQGNHLTATADDGTVLNYTINPELQRQVTSYLEMTRPAYAVLVALEPSSGRILSLAGYSSLDPSWQQAAAYQTYPMASLFKMVTAAAALENRKISPETVMAFRGRLVSETPKNWDPHPRGRNLQMDLTTAMAKSVNPVYGLIASELLGKEQLQQACNRFGFNRSLLLPGVPAIPSSAPQPETVYGLRLQGCGLDHGLKVSPIHAATITAAIANRGNLMAPRLVDQASRDGKPLEVPAPKVIERVMSPETASSLNRMLITTVTSGTSRRAFRSGEGRQLVREMQIAAKTGSIDGDNPKGHYSWFAAYAPADRPQIALVALVINGDKWKIKASQLGEQALSAFFRQDR